MLRFAHLALVAVFTIFGLVGMSAQADAANVTYHLRGVAAQSVGFDGTTNVVAENTVTYSPIVGTQWRGIAQLAAPTATVKNRIREGGVWSGTEQFLRVYSPAYATAKQIGANATALFTTYSDAGSVYAEIYEYSDSTGVVGAKKGTSNTVAFSNVNGEESPLTFNNAIFTVASGNRIVIYFYLISSNADPRPLFGSVFDTVTNAGGINFTVNETNACAATTPSNLAAPTFTSTQVDLTWTYDGTNNNYYTVYRDAVQIATNVTVGAYSDTTAVAGTTYAYTVRGYNTAGTCESVDSNTVNVSTPTCTDNNPSTISIPASQTAFGDGFDASALVTTTGDPKASLGLQFRVTQQQTTAGTAISVGPTFQSTTGGTVYTNETDIDVTYGASGTGTIDTIDVYLTAASSGSTLKFFTATWDGTTVTPKNIVTVTVASNTVGAHQFTGLNLPITAGEFLGVYTGANNAVAQITSGDAMRYVTGSDATGAPYSGTNYAATLNLHGSGTSAPVVNEVACTNWTSTAAIPTTTAGGSLCGNYANGSYSLYSQGTDPTCGTAITSTPVSQPFTWNSCTETATLTLTPIANPITGNVSVTATGTATGIQVGTSPSPTNASGWVYVPVQDDNTTTVSFYATGTGTCGTLTASQLNVGTNTMAAPAVTAFTVPATVVDTLAPLDVPVTTFTATDNLAVTGYLITETPTTPLAAAAGWSALAPAAYTVASYGSYTLYAWSKDAAGNVSLSASAPVTMSNCTEVGTVTLDLLPNPITGVYSVTATVGGGASAPMISVDGTAYSVSPYSYTPPVQGVGTQQFWASATGTCGTIYDAVNPTTGNYDTRTNGTEAGVATAVQSAIDSINVTMPYLGDKNADATFQVDYKLSTSGTWINGTPTLDTGGSPYTQNLTGLISSGTYDVRVTYADIDTILSGIATQNLAVVMVSWADNPMLHNSLRFTGTTKHAGNWGTPGNYAGGITCLTCHAKNSVNVKRIKSSISFPDGSAMPGGGTSATISLLTVEDGASDFGDDSAAPRTFSTKVCEACHTADLTQANGVKQHAANQAAAAGHYDNADCIKCHQHSAGFKADCTTCHGNPPLANTLGGPGGLSNTPATGSGTFGKHDKHVTTLQYACNTCHTGWTVNGQMPNTGNINIGFSAFGDTTATYDGRVAGAYTAQAGTTVATTGALTCSAIYCHGTSTPKWLDTEAAMACGSCHGNATNGAPIETAGDGDLSGAITGKKVGKHVKHVAKYACSVCHNGAGSGTALHVNGTDDVVFDTVVAGASATFTAGTSTCSNLACHTNQVWDTATPALACNSCHGYPPTSAADATNNRHAGVTAVNHDKSVAGSTVAITSNHNECNTCHGKSQTNGLTLNFANGGDDYLASYHIDGNIEMNGWATVSGQDAQYQQVSFGCAKACHANDVPHQLSDSGLPVQLHRYGAGDCNGCHDAGTGGAPVINAASSHVDADGAGATYTAGTCTDCHPGGTKGALHSKNGDINVAVIANNTTVGINYSHVVTGTTTGFVLGGDATTGTSEAEICWGCHDTNGISEWGVNNNAATGGIVFDYGSVTTSNWTTATWTSGTAQFSYKTAAIQSTHSANSISGVQGMDAVGNIRCSYCHDVHNTNTDTVTTAPYLRGEWRGNPYKEDGAPQQGTQYANDNSFGRVPRGTASTIRAMGGYWIDQNTAAVDTPDGRAWTPEQFGGLCEKCHANNDGIFTAAEIGALGGTTGWVSGLNGHANAVKGASHTDTTAARNIFDARGGTQSAYNGLMAYNGYRRPGDAAGGLRGMEKSFAKGPKVLNWTGEPQANGVGVSGGSAVIDWDNLRALNLTGTTVNPDFHHFSCSKCHNPHASRLPRLMITNCLDTKHNTWDNGGTVDTTWDGNTGTKTGSVTLTETHMQIGVNSADTSESTDVGGTAIIPAVLRGTTVSNWTTAQNCHRLAGDDPNHLDDAPGQGGGWNTVTPW